MLLPGENEAGTTKRSPGAVAVVTGGAGGLGAALTRELVGAGWRVAAGFHTTSSGLECSDRLSVPLDVTDAEAVRQAIRVVKERLGEIDLLVNNAGVSHNDPIWSTTEEEWDRTLDVNLRGAFLCSRAVLPRMQERRIGQIINISSHAALSGSRGHAAYAASKAALIGLTQSLAREAGPSDVRVNAVLPGVLRTPMTAELDPEVLEAFANANALGRLNSLEEVARFIAFLAELRNVSGQVFPLDSRIARWA